MIASAGSGASVREGVTFERPATRQDEFAGKPGLVRFIEVPARPFVMIDGEGPPEDSTFAPRMPGLYSTAYGLRFTLKRRGLDEPIGPLEGLWWTTDDRTEFADIVGDDRGTWRWTLMIAIPAGATTAERETALAVGRAKMHPDLAPKLRIETYDEGRVAQVLHLGPYSTERSTIELLHRAINEAGLEPMGRHHEIYLGDPRRARPDRLRTLIRQPVALPR